MKYSISLSMLVVSMLVVGAEDPFTFYEEVEKKNSPISVSSDAELEARIAARNKDFKVFSAVVVGAAVAIAGPAAVPAMAAGASAMGAAIWGTARYLSKPHRIEDGKEERENTLEQSHSAPIPPADPFPTHLEELPQSPIGLNHQWMSVAMRNPLDNSMRSYQFPYVRRRAASDPEKAIIDAVRRKRRDSVTALLDQGVDPHYVVDYETPLIWVAVESYISSREGEDRTTSKDIIEKLIDKGCQLGCSFFSQEEGLQTVLSRGVERWDAQDLSSFIDDFLDKLSIDVLNHAHVTAQNLVNEDESAELRTNMQLVEEAVKMKMEQHND